MNGFLKGLAVAGMLALAAGCATSGDVRSLLVHPDEFTDRWVDRAVAMKLDVLALHPVGGWDADRSLTNLIDRCRQPEFRARVDRAIDSGLTIEYECHAGSWLLPRDLFVAHPEYFRMDKEGKRVPRFNFCVSNAEALSLVANRARLLARCLYRSSHNYFFWLDDAKDSNCLCPTCSQYSPSDLQLIVLNRMLAEIRKDDPEAKLAFLAYYGTLKCPTKVKPADGIFVEFAPIQRKWDRPAVEQPEAVDVAEIRALLAYFGCENSRVLEYWFDNSLFSQWKKPPKRFTANAEVVAADLRFYAELGFKGFSSFACYLGDDYEQLWGEPDVSAFARKPSR